MANPEPLVLPRGVRFPRDDEFPRGRERERAEVAAARLTTGYVHHSGTTDAYDAYFEANVHAHELWNAFRALALALLPDVGAPIIGIKDDSPLLGPYTDRDAAIAALEPHAYQLQHDGFLEFGIIFQHKGRTEEVFVPSAKYLKVWTNQAPEAERVFSELGDS